MMVIQTPFGRRNWRDAAGSTNPCNTPVELPWCVASSSDSSVQGYGRAADRNGVVGLSRGPSGLDDAVDAPSGIWRNRRRAHAVAIEMKGERLGRSRVVPDACDDCNRNAEGLEPFVGHPQLDSSAYRRRRLSNRLDSDRLEVHEDARGEEEGAGTGEQHEAENAAGRLHALTIDTAALSRRAGAIGRGDHSM